MKKIVSLIAMATMLAVSTPAFADHRNRDFRWGNDRNVNSPYRGQHHRRDRGINTGEAIAIIGGIAVLSTIINNNRRRNNDPVVIDQRVRRAPQGCQDIIQYDYYGNPYVVDRRCWYNR